jgi:hypothetical protein
MFPHVWPDEPLYGAQAKERTVRPDFVLVRNFPLDSHGDTFKSQLMGLMFADLPAGTFALLPDCSRQLIPCIRSS